MAKTALSTIKNWFKTGSKPTQSQFWNVFDSFFHKDEKLQVSDVDQLSNYLNQKAEKQSLNNHQTSDTAHQTLFDQKQDRRPVREIANTSSLIFDELDKHKRIYSTHTSKINYIIIENRFQKNDVLQLFSVGGGMLSGTNITFVGSTKIPANSAVELVCVATNVFTVEFSLQPQSIIEGTYENVKALKDENRLIPGKKYAITDYQTEYFIEGSNSSGIVRNKTITDYISFWSVLDNSYDYELVKGMTVEITELPESYSGELQVGDTTKVSSKNQNYYFKFANGMQKIIGIKFKYYLTRYTTITENATINDNNGTPVMKAGGIINTEVHNGTAYCEQSAIENLSVPVERIVLTASTENTFEEVGYSDTFENDVIYYDFDNIDIVNDNKEVIGTRKGYIKRRTNPLLNIDVPLDWRVYRFRRWLLDTASRTQLINQDLDVNTTRVGLEGKFLYTSQNRTSTNINPFYIAKTPEATMQNINDKALIKDFTIVAESNIHCKDFTVIPLDGTCQPIKVEKFNASVLYNTVFLGLDGEYTFDLHIEDAKLIGSTFVSNIKFFGEKWDISNCTVLDSLNVKCSGSIWKKVTVLSHFAASRLTNSHLNRVIFGTHKGGDISGTPNPNPAAKWVGFSYMDNCDLEDVVIGQGFVYLCMDSTQIVNSSIFLYYSPVFPDGKRRERVYIRGSVFSNVCLTVPRNLTQVGFNNIYFGKTNSASSDNLFIYDITPGDLNQKNIQLNDENKNLYYETIDANNQKTITTLVSPTLTS